jgi:(2Fe-2S) ferredoxin
VLGQAPVKYANLTPEKMAQVFERHVLGGEVVTDAALAAGCETTG